MTDDGGNYTMEVGSRQGHRGVVPGQYSVVVSRFVGDDGKPLGRDWKQADYPSARETIPPKYSGASSPIKVEVKDIGGEINIEIPEGIMSKKK